MNKYFRFLLGEFSGLVRIVLCIVCVVAIMFESKVWARQQKEIRIAESQKALVMRIPEMQAKLEALEALRRNNIVVPPEPAKPPEPPVELSWQLNGTITDTAKPIAFINNQIYELGGVIEGYKVIVISRQEVLLQNETTQRVATLRFSE